MWERCVDLGVQFFTAAKAQHESATKWSLIVFAVLLYFHLAIVGPFARQTAEMAELDQDLAGNKKLESQLAPVVDAAAAFVDSVQSEVKEASTALRDDLVARFGILHDKIGKIIDLGPDRAAGEEGAALFEPERADMFQQQQQQVTPPPGTLVPTLDPMPPDLRRQLAETTDSSQDVGQLEHYINESVIAPAFASANDSWAGHRDSLGSRADQLNQELEATIKAAGSAGAQLKALQQAVSALRDEAQRLRFAPPEGSDWWRTVAGKESSIRIMMGAMTQGIGDISQRQDALRAAKEKTSAIIADNQQRAKQAAEKLAELERQAADLQAQLGQIGQPLKVISIRLPVLAPLLPLVIALAAAALALWDAQALRRMGFAASLVADETENRMLRRWLQDAAGGSAQMLAAREILIAVCVIAWLLVAWLAVRSMPGPPLPQIAIIGIAAAALAGGRAYHWYQSGRALVLSRAN